MTQLLILFVIVLVPITLTTRYYIFAKYTHLPETPGTRTDNTSLLPTIEQTDKKKYLPSEIYSQFLSEIKIFSFLDSQVISEIAKNALQKKYEQGSLLWDSHESGRDLSLVMDGSVQVFLTKSHDNETFDNPQLLTEVGPGGTVTSLFSILSIFLIDSPFCPYHNLSHAYATVDSTILIIPEAVFNMIAVKYPSASLQMIQIILTRFQRVTFLTLYKYLGLTKELYSIERMVNEHSLSSILFNKSELVSILNHGVKFPRDQQELFKETTRSKTDFSLELTKRRIRNVERSMSISGIRVDRPRNMSVQDSSIFNKTFENAFDPGPTKVAFSGSSQTKNSIIKSFARELGIMDFQTTVKMGEKIIEHDTGPLNLDLDNDLQILFFEEGSILVHQGERNAGIYYVLDGVLGVSIKNTDKSKLKKESTEIIPQIHRSKSKGDIYEDFSKDEKSLFLINPGGIAGYLATLTGHPSFVNIRAKTDCFVGFLSKGSMDNLVEKYPSVLLTLAERLSKNLSPLVIHIDFALEWTQVNAGKILFSQDDKSSDSIYIVLNGRLRASQSKNGQTTIIGEYGQGESVGELEVLTNTPRNTTVHAIRDTELAKMPNTLFHALAARHPEITIQISRIIAKRSGDLQGNRYRYNEKANINLKTVAILPLSQDVPIMEFATRLKDGLQSIEATTTILDSQSSIGALGRHSFRPYGRLKLIRWLTEQEENVRIVLYVADGSVNSSWTQRCIGQADCILLVALYDQDTAVTDIEMLMNKSSSSASKELVLLHGDRNFVRGNTSAFLKDRPWLITHHHVEIPIEVHRTAKKNALDDLSRNLRPLFNKFQRFTEFYLKGRKPITRKHRGSRSDFAKLARRLMGESVGLVLGGGGARGLAHIGIIQAFEEADIPIDLVGGCSIGSFIGGLYALNEDIWYVYWRAKEFSQRMDSKWRQILDLTYPLTAWFTGHEFNRGLWKSFGDARIEDCWLNYFNVTTNISMSRLEVHMSGYLWRYIRASMTLSGYLPPICDNGHMLLDGGYLNNLPGDIIRALGADTVIAVDVGGEFDKVVADYGDYLSGWFALFQSFLSRFSLKHKFVPTLAEVQSRLAYVSSVKQLEDIKNMRGCRYLKPPVGNFGLLDFGRFEEIYNVGYNYGKEIIKEWESTGLIQTKQVSKKQVLKHHARRSSI